jgi:two-component system NtrC family sensor kinase
MMRDQTPETFRLLESAKRDWEQTFDAIRDVILLLDADGTVVRVNRAAREKLGRGYREIVGRRLEDLVGARGEEAVRRALEKTDADGGTIGVPELKGIFEVSAYWRSSETSGRSGYVVVLVDVTEKERLREQLLHSEKLSALGELISGIAHELNNPLTAVLGYAQILSLKAEGRFGKELSHMKAESLRASRIVRNLLTFARRRANTREPEDLNDVVRKTAALREYDLRVRNIRLDLVLAGSLPRSMMDRSQMQQVVLNLLNNAEYAIHTVREGGRIRVATAEREGKLLLTV